MLRSFDERCPRPDEASPQRPEMQDQGPPQRRVPTTRGPISERDLRTRGETATQRPVAAAAFSDVSGPPAWKSLPSWAVLGAGDKAAGTDVVRSMAQRAGGISTTSRPNAGRAGYERYRNDFAELIWQLGSPRWEFDEATFDRTAQSLHSPDHVDIVIHNYRWRLGLADGEPEYEDLERRLAEVPVITVPAITLEGDANGAPHSDPASYAEKFTGKYRHRLIAGGVGHNLPQEAPQAFAEAVIESTASDRRAHEGETDGPGGKRMEDAPHQSQPARPLRHASRGPVAC